VILDTFLTIYTKSGRRRELAPMRAAWGSPHLRAFLLLVIITVMYTVISTTSLIASLYG
jgi:hypothetical protein